MLKAISFPLNPCSFNDYCKEEVKPWLLVHSKQELLNQVEDQSDSRCIGKKMVFISSDWRSLSRLRNGKILFSCRNFRSLLTLELLESPIKVVCALKSTGVTTADKETLSGTLELGPSYPRSETELSSN